MHHRSLTATMMLLTGAALGDRRFAIRMADGSLMGPAEFRVEDAPLTPVEIRDAAAGQKGGAARDAMDRFRLVYEARLLGEDEDLTELFPEDDETLYELTAVRLRCTPEDHEVFSPERYRHCLGDPRLQNPDFRRMARLVRHCAGWADVRSPDRRPMVNWATSLITKRTWREKGVEELITALLEDEDVIDSAAQELGTMHPVNGHYDQGGNAVHHFAVMGDADAAIPWLQRIRDMVDDATWDTMVNAATDYTPHQGETPLSAALYKGGAPLEQLPIAAWLMDNGASTDGPQVAYAVKRIVRRYPELSAGLAERCLTCLYGASTDGPQVAYAVKRIVRSYPELSAGLAERGLTPPSPRQGMM